MSPLSLESDGAESPASEQTPGEGDEGGDLVAGPDDDILFEGEPET
jgi:hypothetical protein